MEKEEFKKFQQVAREHFWTAQFGGMVRVWNDDRMWFFSDIEYTEGSNYFKGTFSEEEKNEMNDYVETFFYLSNGEMFRGNQIGNFIIDKKTDEVYLLKDGKLSYDSLPNMVFYAKANGFEDAILVQFDDKTISAIDDNGEVLVGGIELKRGTSVKLLDTPVLNSKVTVVVETGKKVKMFSELGEVDMSLLKSQKPAELGDQ